MIVGSGSRDDLEGRTRKEVLYRKPSATVEESVGSAALCSVPIPMLSSVVRFWDASGFGSYEGFEYMASTLPFDGLSTTTAPSLVPERLAGECLELVRHGEHNGVGSLLGGEQVAEVPDGLGVKGELHCCTDASIPVSDAVCV